MGKVYFVFGIHNHQPVGNFDFVFEDAYQRAYLPFLELLEAHPRIRLAQHYSGILFDWILENHPEYIDRLAQMVHRGQVELISGAHYEPILMTIPDRDKIGQIKKLTRMIYRHTRYRARGFWLAERVWEPHLPKVLRESGVEYTIVDDAHFKYAGLKEDKLTGYYVTEEQGVPLNIFPISEKLRYTIPFQDPEATLDYFRFVSSLGENQLAIFADDGEKFGVWPGTYDHVFKHRWLEHFFEALEENSDWVEMIHFSEALDRIPPKGRVYLPTASYREMMEWALPATAFQELEDFEQKLKDLGLFEKYHIYVRGGFWRNFLAKYPESNRMHKKMLYVSDQLETHRKKFPPEKLAQAKDHLWAGQCNCPYWHGIFGGLYLPHLRHAIYQNLIEAEIMLDQVLAKTGVETKVMDFTGNGREDILVESPLLNLYIDPHLGGNIFELDFKPVRTNILDTMTRHKEGYHRKLLEAEHSHGPDGEVASIHDMVLAKEKHLERYLKYDWYLRNALIDHFMPLETPLQDFADAAYREWGDFVQRPYEYRVDHTEASARIHLSRLGNLWPEGHPLPFFVKKTLKILPDSAEMDIRYLLENRSDQEVACLFGVEWNLGLQAGNSPDRYYEINGRKPSESHLAGKGEEAQVREIALVDEWQKFRVSFRFPQPARLWRFPIETVSMSEAGFERVYQNSVLLPLWELRLKPGEKREIRFGCQLAVIE